MATAISRAEVNKPTGVNGKVKISRLSILKPVVFLLCLLPLALLVYGAVTDTLGVNPVETLTRNTGDWALYFLLITLAVTPLRQLLGWSWLIRYRRMFGLYVFFYACLHFLTYVWFDQYFNWEEILKDVIKRPFITIGFTCLLLLIPLALTSTNKMMRRLKKNWQKLHNLVYPISLLAVLHYFLMIKADYQEATVVLIILLSLLAYRLVNKFKSTVS